MPTHVALRDRHRTGARSFTIGGLAMSLESFKFLFHSVRPAPGTDHQRLHFALLEGVLSELELSPRSFLPSPKILTLGKHTQHTVLARGSDFGSNCDVMWYLAKVRPRS